MTNNDGTTLSDMELIIEETSTEETSDENEKTSSAYEQLKESTTEDDDDMTGTLTLRQILGGDHLLVFVRHHVWLILLIMLLTTVYVGFRYQCQKDVIEISDLEKVLTDAKYKALASSSNLTELCRQSNVLKVLRENNDSLLRISDQPPYIINIPEE
ncbi:FtsL-like putative cell division protein [Xylanibacter brevis]|uniref:FtsL-like putative cell division protein n=1 Tax=Xylanibacter brevis TaxID=83231 RepID=UPI000693EFC2|nr:FtsL-like putative cell division protein [Xylanibacter brevis]